MGKYIYLLLFTLMQPLLIQAQELTIKEMKATNDLSASQYRRMDRNNEPCGLVKVRLATMGAQFEGNVIPPVEYKTGEYWVYMSKGSRELHVKHPSFLPIEVHFGNYGLSRGIQSLTTYTLTLAIPQTDAPTQTQKLIIDYSPTNAIVVVDSKPHQGNGHLELTLPIGNHDYQIVAMGYDAVEGSVKLNASSPRTITERLTASKQQTAVQPTNTQKPIAHNNKTKPDEDPETAGLSNTQIFGLAFNYANGVRGKSVDYAKALKYYQISAERGNSDAMNNIGIMYEKGQGVATSKTEAAKWFRKAAEAGQSTAQITLGEYYEKGLGGLPQSISQAKYWYQKAADKGRGDAKKALERINATISNATPTSTSSGQTTIQGTVYDKKSKEPIIGASIRVKDTRIGAVTDFNGNFKIKVPANDKITLIINYVGFKSQNINVDSTNNSPLKIYLRE